MGWFAATGNPAAQAALHAEAQAVRGAFPGTGPTQGYTGAQAQAGLQPETAGACPDAVRNVSGLAVDFAQGTGRLDGTLTHFRWTRGRDAPHSPRFYRGN